MGTENIKLAKVLPGCPLDRCDWLLVAGRHRDSEILEESNFDAVLKELGGESDTIEVLRFNHFAVGWIEEIVVHPDRWAEVAKIKAQLDAYPVWDEDDFSARESEAALEAWVSFGCRAFAEGIQEEFDLMDSTRAWLERSPDWTLHVFENTKPYVLYTEGDTVHVRAYGGQTELTRDQLAAAIKQIRKEVSNRGNA